MSPSPLFALGLGVPVYCAECETPPTDPKQMLNEEIRRHALDGSKAAVRLLKSKEDSGFPLKRRRSFRILFHMKSVLVQCARPWLLVALITVLFLVCVCPARSQTNNYEFNDSHFHLTNNIQEGPNIHEFLNMMGTKAGRVAIFGVPLQQQWSYRTDGDRAPTYYLHSDAPLYYYSFSDALIAMAYRSLTKEQQARFDPMITGFNPTDMYAADHIRR